VPRRRQGRWSDPRAGSRRIRATRRRSSARRPPPGVRPAVETSPGYRFVVDPRDPETELARAGALVLVVVVVIMIILPVLLGLAAART
jgi:hypothetical protein